MPNPTIPHHAAACAHTAQGGNRRVQFVDNHSDSDSDASSSLVAPSERPGVVVSLGRPRRESLFSLAKLKQLELPEAPACLRCPISGMLMVDPVDASDGVTYDREHIAALLRQGHRTSPVTGQSLQSTELRPNHSMKAAATAHKEIRQEVERQWRALEASVSGYMEEFGQQLEQQERQSRELEVRIAALQSGRHSARGTKHSAKLSAASTADCSPPEQGPRLMANAAAVAAEIPQCAFSAGPAPRSARGERASPRPLPPPQATPRPRATPREQRSGEKDTSSFMGLRTMLTPRIMQMVRTPRGVRKD